MSVGLTLACPPCTLCVSSRDFEVIAYAWKLYIGLNGYIVENTPRSERSAHWTVSRIRRKSTSIGYTLASKDHVTRPRDNTWQLSQTVTRGVLSTMYAAHLADLKSDQMLGYIFVADSVGLHSYFRGGLGKTHVFWNTMRNGPSRSSKVVDFGTNLKRVCNFLLVINSNIGHILLRFRDITGFLKRATPPPFHPNFGVFPWTRLPTLWLRRAKTLI